MEQLAERIVGMITESALVEVEVSARHVHLTREDVDILFGKGAKLTPKKDLSQIGQFACEERVTLVGPKGKKERVSVLGPERPATQVEISLSDAMQLGVDAPVRESGDLHDAAPLRIEGPCGSIERPHCCIAAKAHLHTTPAIAKQLGLVDKQLISVKLLTERSITLNDIVVRVSEKFRHKVHIDTDEANAAKAKGFILGKLMK